MKGELLLFLFLLPLCFCFESTKLLEDVHLAKQISYQEHHRELPVIYNYEGLAGYFNMPSSRSGKSGVFGATFFYLPPYHNFNVTVTLFRFLELSGTYHVFKGVPDTFLGPGFGDVADRSANVKLIFLHPEDSDYMLPGFAVGMNDCLGTEAFRADFIVGTYVFPNLNTEISLGYGKKRINGFFGGIAITPFRRSSNPFLKGLTLAAEYDAFDYTNPTFEPSPFGREVKNRINVGIHYRFLNFFHFQASTIRGKDVAIGGGIYTNLGDFKGLFIKFKDVPLYKGPEITEPIGTIRSYDMLAQDLVKAFRKQGFSLFQAGVYVTQTNEKHLYLRIRNNKWRDKEVAKKRVESILCKLIPSNIDKVIVQIESDTIPVVQYSYPHQELQKLREGLLCPYELNLLTHNENITYPKQDHYRLIWKSNKSSFDIAYKPFVRLFFGSASGKVKYDASFIFGPCGYLANSIYYKVMVGFNVIDDLKNVRGVDKVNPSQLINVRSDSVLFYRSNKPYLEKAYLQKNFSFSKGWFARLSVGYFEIAYAGIASEILYYPAKSQFAIGIEGALVKKRAYSGLKLENDIRKFTGFIPSFVPFFGTQYFLNIYYDFKKLSTEFHLRLGQFLAKDVGGVLTLTRYFPSGVRLSVWYGITDVKDIVNGKRYNEIGARISIPIDLFLPVSSKSRVGSGGSAWLRDIAAVADNGMPLYKIVQEERSSQ